MTHICLGEGAVGTAAGQMCFQNSTQTGDGTLPWRVPYTQGRLLNVPPMSLAEGGARKPSS